MHRRLLLDPAPEVTAAASRVCGLHAQVASRTVLIAGVRTAQRPDLDAALWKERSLVRTWAMRGTLHLLPAAELDVRVGARSDRESRRRFPPAREREHGVTGTRLHAVTEPSARCSQRCRRPGPSSSPPSAPGWASPPPHAGCSARTAVD